MFCKPLQLEVLFVTKSRELAQAVRVARCLKFGLVARQTLAKLLLQQWLQRPNILHILNNILLRLYHLIQNLKYNSFLAI